MPGMFLLGLLGVGALIGLIDLINDDDPPPPPPPPGGEDGPSDGPDLLTAAEDGNNIEGQGGSDSIVGSDATDLLSGEDGADELTGGGDDDLLFGGRGSDFADGGEGDDIVAGGRGDDVLRGGNGDDLLSGDKGADTLVGGLGDDALFGTDTALGSVTASEFQTLLDENADDPVNALFLPEVGEEDSDDGDQLVGAYGDDLLVLGNDDTGAGGEGADIFNIGDWISPDSPATITDYDPAVDRIVFTFDLANGMPGDLDVITTDDGLAITVGGETIALVNGAEGSLTADDIAILSRSSETGAANLVQGSSFDEPYSFGDGDDTLSAGGGADSAELAGGDDVADGESGHDTLLGGAGDDALSGGADNDLLVDVAGADSLNGGLGADTLVGSGFGGASELGPDSSFDMANIDLSSDSDATGDNLFGGYGPDQILFGANDTVGGGAESDSFITSDAGLENGPSTITDFNAEEDTLMVSLSAGNAADLTITYSDGATETDGDAMVMIGDTLLMTVAGVGTGFTAADISVVTRS